MPPDGRPEDVVRASQLFLGNSWFLLFRPVPRAPPATTPKRNGRGALAFRPMRPG